VTLLLDTHTLIWWLEGNRKLGRRARGAIESTATIVWISAASAWEIAIKVSLGRLDLAEPPGCAFPGNGAQPFPATAVSLVHALAVRTLPRIMRIRSIACSSRRPGRRLDHRDG
jgi:PIN domain nuclease of toxin-antitoxin system